MNKFIIVFLIVLFPLIGFCQEDTKTDPENYDTLTAIKHPYVKDTTYENWISGEFTPGKGFDIIKTEFGSLNISGYGLIRWIDQVPNENTFADNQGRSRGIKGRNDIYFQRGMIWITGFLGTQKLRYNVTLWGLGATQQTLLFGNLQYVFGTWLRIGAGVGPNLGIRSLQGSWPYWNGSDRQLGEETLRPGFSQALWVTGEMLPRLYYNVEITDNLSILGAKADALTRDLATSASVWWMPTTGEFGPRGGHHDFEDHHMLSTRLGFSLVHFRDSKQSPATDSTSGNTQVKLTDGVNLFERSALQPGVQLLYADFNMGSIDFGFKYRGFFFQTQYFFRNLSRFDILGTIPDPVHWRSSIFDQGIQVDISHMLIPKTLNAYVSGTYMYDKFERHPSEISAGLNYFPLHTRNWRLNAHFISVNKSSASSLFGYYTAGMTGPIFTLSTDILF